MNQSQSMDFIDSNSNKWTLKCLEDNCDNVNSYWVIDDKEKLLLIFGVKIVL